MNKGKSIFIGSWLLSILILAAINTSFESKQESFVGIADQQEEFISFPYPVKIREIFPVEGEKLRTGDLVLDVIRPDLASKQTMLTYEIEKISAEKGVTQAELKARLASLRAKQNTDLAKLDAAIQELKTKREINLQLLAQISGTDSSINSNDSGTLGVKLEGLKKQRRILADSLGLAISSLKQQMASNDKPNEAKIAKLTVEKQELKRQQASLEIHAQFDSRVGSILYKPGEQVPAFTKIMSLHSLSPQHVKGFIHENSDSQIAPGQVVWVHSQSSENKSLISGKIESLGSRIVEYPQRLKKSALSQAWGREVTVSIDHGNTLLLGEKVVINLEPKKPLTDQITLSAIRLSNKFNWAKDEENNSSNKFSVANIDALTK